MVMWRLYSDSQEGCISIIYQELSVINELSILENLFVDKLPSSFMGDKSKLPGVVMGALIIISVAIVHFIAIKK